MAPTTARRATGASVLRGWLGAVLACLLLPAWADNGDVHRLGIDDLLKLEGIGAARVGPLGRRLVWEQSPPYDALGDYGIGQFAATGQWFHLEFVDLGESVPVVREPFRQSDKASYRVDGFSPTGRYLLFYRYLEGQVRLGIHDFDSGRTRMLDIAPTIEVWGFPDRESVWVSASKFVVAALPAGSNPVDLVLRRETASRFADAWSRTWRGREPSASVVTTRGTERAHAGRLLLVDAGTGRQTVLARGHFEDIALSTDRRYLGAVRRGPPSPSIASDTGGWFTNRHDAYVFDLVGPGEGRVISRGMNVMPGSLAWSFDGARLAFFGWRAGAGAGSGLYRAFDVTTGELHAYPHNGLNLVSERERCCVERPERMVWLGNGLAVFARKNDASTVPGFRFAGSGEVARDVEPNWYLVDPQGNTELLGGGLAGVSPLTVFADKKGLVVLSDTGLWRLAAGKQPESVHAEAGLAFPVREQYAVLHKPFRAQRIFMHESSGSDHYTLVDLENGDATKLTTRGVAPELVVASVARRSVLYRTPGVEGSELRLESASGDDTTLAVLNAPLAGIEGGTWRMLDAADGRSHCALLPPGFEPGRRYPVIVEIYPGRGPGRCANASGSTGFTQMQQSVYDVELLAAKGFIVLQPDARKIRTPAGPIQGVDAAIESAISALDATGHADLSRIGLLGVSQGGFTALWEATQSKRFKAVVSISGWSDPYTHYYEASVRQKFFSDQYPFIGAITRYEAGDASEFGLGASPQEAIYRYMANSPLLHSDLIAAPVLLIHSDMDGFNVGQYEMMFTALKARGKRAKLIRYWGEGHVPSSPANVRHMWNAVFEWFEAGLCTSDTSSGQLQGQGCSFGEVANVHGRVACMGPAAGSCAEN